MQLTRTEAQRFRAAAALLQPRRHSRDTVVRFPSTQQREEGIMGILMICCPATGRPVSTEIEMDRLEQLPTVIATITCPACGGVHEWTRHDAWLAAGGDHYRRAAASKAAVKSDRRQLSAM